MAALRLQLDNVASLPDGGPTSFEVRGGRSVEIGRNTYLDWTLPDEQRLVSGKHCEIHYRDGSYWIVDVSTNGTFLNGSDKRLTEPWRLRTGDRLGIGDYLVSVLVEDERTEPVRPEPRLSHSGPDAPPAGASLWDVPDGDAAVPDPPEVRRIRASRPVRADMLDWVADLPTLDRTAAEPAAAADLSVPPPASTDDRGDGEGVAQAPMPPVGTWQAAADDPADRTGLSSPRAEMDTPPDAWSIPISAPSETPSVTTLERPVVVPILAAVAVPAQPVSPDPTETTMAPERDRAAAGFRADSDELPDFAATPAVQPVATEAILRRPGQDAPFSGDPDLVHRSVPEGRAGAPGASLTLQAGQPGRAVSPPPGAAPALERSARSPEAALPAGATVTTGQENLAGDGAALDRLLVALAAELGIPVHRIAGQSPEELGHRLGRFMRLSVGGLHELLRARASSRGYLRAGAGTMVQAVGNNPLKFMPTTEAAIDLLLGPPSASYLDIDATLNESFHDLGAHQVALYSAMQKAVQRLLSDLEPAAIEAEGEGRAGFINTAATRKAKHWDTYKERYQARADAHDNGMIDVFMLCFSDAYERALKGDD